MKDVETQAVHVEILHSEAVEYKRDLLEMQLHLLDILKAIISIKELRKIEFKLKEEVRGKIREIAAEIDRIIGGLPVSEVETHTTRKESAKFRPLKKEARETKEKAKIDAELREIKRQLEKLG